MLTNKPKIICNSRHWSVMAWLEQHYPGLNIAYRPGARPQDLDQDTCLVSTYPLHLLAAAGDAVNIEYGIRPSSAELTPAQMDQHQARPIHYHVVRSEHPDIPEVYADFVSWFAAQPIEARLAMLADLVQRFG